MRRAPTRRAVLAGGLAALAAPLGAATDRWSAVADRAAGLDQLHAMIVSVDGDIVFERRFRGPPLSRPVNVKSVSKTVVAALLGAAIDRGEVVSLDARLGDVAPDLVPAGADPRVARLTMGDLVTMQAGLERTSGSNYGAWISSSDWVADALSRPFVAEPGERMLYSTGSFHVLGAALAAATDASLLSQARMRLGEPLGIEIPPWTRDPQGRYMGGNQMALSPAAMIRFGETYRLGGVYDGVRVLGADWVAASWEPRTRSPFSGMSYGLGWFLGRVGGERFALARGYGGQVICVLPDRETTLAITSDPTRPARSEGYFGDLMDLIGETVGAV